VSQERALESRSTVYGYSKFLFDQYVRRSLPEPPAADAGSVLYVYDRASAQGGMAPWSCTFYRQYAPSRSGLRVGGFAAGEQRPIFVSVETVVKVNLDFLTIRRQRSQRRAGKATTLQRGGRREVTRVRAAAGQARQSVAESLRRG